MFQEDELRNFINIYTKTFDIKDYVLFIFISIDLDPSYERIGGGVDKNVIGRVNAGAKVSGAMNRL